MLVLCGNNTSGSVTQARDLTSVRLNFHIFKTQTALTEREREEKRYKGVLGESERDLRCNFDFIIDL